jgi:hypothetical protein
MINVDGP